MHAPVKKAKRCEMDLISLGPLDVHHQKTPAGPKYASRFGEHLAPQGLGQVVHHEAAQNQIEGRVVEGQSFGGDNQETSELPCFEPPVSSLTKDRCPLSGRRFQTVCAPAW